MRDAEDQLRQEAEQERREKRKGKVGRPSSEAARLNRGLELMEEYELEGDED